MDRPVEMGQGPYNKSGKLKYSVGKIFGVSPITVI